jgi:hypothetical protein
MMSNVCAHGPSAKPSPRFTNNLSHYLIVPFFFLSSVWALIYPKMDPIRNPNVDPTLDF